MDQFLSLLHVSNAVRCPLYVSSSFPSSLTLSVHLPPSLSLSLSLWPAICTPYGLRKSKNRPDPFPDWKCKSLVNQVLSSVLWLVVVFFSMCCVFFDRAALIVFGYVVFFRVFVSLLFWFDCQYYCGWLTGNWKDSCTRWPTVCWLKRSMHGNNEKWANILHHFQYRN